MTIQQLAAACALICASAVPTIGVSLAAQPSKPSQPSPTDGPRAGPTSGRSASGVTGYTPQKGDEDRGAVTVDHAYARATAPGQPTGGAFMTLVNHGDDDKLLSARATVSRSVELHEMSMDGNVMHMRQVDAIAIKSGETVALKPGGYHVMFVGLNAPLKAGTQFPVTLTFQKAREITVDVKVEAGGAVPEMKH